jgi:hypothetical protein
MGMQIFRKDSDMRGSPSRKLRRLIEREAGRKDGKQMARTDKQFAIGTRIRKRVST